jgi:hypothetical protein
MRGGNSAIATGTLQLSLRRAKYYVVSPEIALICSLDLESSGVPAEPADGRDLHSMGKFVRIDAGACRGGSGPRTEMQSRVLRSNRKYWKEVNVW